MIPSRFPRALGYLLLIPLGVVVGVAPVAVGEGRSSGIVPMIVVMLVIFVPLVAWILSVRWRTDALWDRLRTAHPDAVILEAQRTPETVSALPRVQSNRFFSLAMMYFLVIDEDGVAIHSSSAGSEKPVVLAWDRLGPFSTGAVRIGRHSGTALVVTVAPSGEQLPVAVRDSGPMAAVRISPTPAGVAALIEALEEVRRRPREGRTPSTPTAGGPAQEKD
ncbi:hypothetical protein [Rathayibacter sp. VKM Ac-2630]|uniref:hypothetical protein n=1 Tax=Rathayibacter sp. VKM Ac-2630 TaxID=1938617 RepID=UPI000980B1CA|nr:hypothetical protein [Rathayibacter sp. VKM Ac-2630]OOB91061.1 hypothetical protein B0T42_08335 [Rathayibacter sp. VKM Ac-2630]